MTAQQRESIKDAYGSLTDIMHSIEQAVWELKNKAINMANLDDSDEREIDDLESASTSITEALEYLETYI